MIIAMVDFDTAASDRAAALAHLDSDSDLVRAMPGNLSYRVFASREDETRVTVTHEWDDEESFDGYLKSDVFARAGAVLRPMMTGSPVSRRFRAEPMEIAA
ncbi:antibiotic biosynthesis monooxygenase [Nonomuraea sp. SMC257]|uniref:Antibiotic biosynthesis monooxygenase n=1 Tax=Nonomuraea montanisoli TaxID=2741721 RepID=A0A7Y6M186_9ACTN|nr:antibiotic biosynthesis monooxygenase [Nonomuraea montanisoli]NUW29869.1 antibiotic biosynthesis monooxygenase [Nonomuraea montanisoli]